MEWKLILNFILDTIQPMLLLIRPWSMREKDMSSRFNLKLGPKLEESVILDPIHLMLVIIRP